MDPVYRVKVELVSGEDTELAKKLKEGIECEGFVILANREKDHHCVLHHISIMDIATMIAGNSYMLGAGILAKAMREAKDLKEPDFSKILRGLS